MVVVDRLSKYAHFILLKHPFNTKSVAAVFVKEVVRLHGYPWSIISDRDNIFTSIFWEELFWVSGTQLRCSTAYHPQTDGQSEVVNHGLETYLRCFAMGTPKHWAKWILWAEFSYNTSFIRWLNCRPLKFYMGIPHLPFFIMNKGYVLLEQSIRSCPREMRCWSSWSKH